MRGLVLLIAGGAAYWAFKNGHLPQLAPVVAAVKAAAPNILPMDQWNGPADAKAEYVADIKAASGGKVVPLLGAGEVVTVNAHEAMLRSNLIEVSGWAKRNMGWAAAISRVENASMNPTISGDNGTSHGVYQVKVATAETCYRAGYTRYAPTKETLLTTAGGVYFGTAEMERLSGINDDLDWITQAYNGGAGFEKMGAKYVKDRAAYLVRVKRAFAALYGKNMV